MAGPASQERRGIMFILHQDQDSRRGPGQAGRGGRADGPGRGDPGGPTAPRSPARGGGGAGAGKPPAAVMTRAPGTPRRRLGLLPALPPPGGGGVGGGFVSAVGSGLTLPCPFIYASRVRDLSYGTAGLVVATIALASLAGNPAGGAAADRWTPRRALMAGLVLAAAGSVALALAHTAAALFGAARLLGLGVSLIWPAPAALPAS